MSLSYKQLYLLWGLGLLLAAIIAGITGLLVGDGDWWLSLYQCSAILLVIAIAFLGDREGRYGRVREVRVIYTGACLEVTTLITSFFQTLSDSLDRGWTLAF